jgi:hypothetical protein
VIPDDIAGYAALESFGRIPIAGGEHQERLTAVLKAAFSETPRPKVIEPPKM